MIESPEEKELWAGIAKARQAYLSTRDTIFKAKKDGDVATAERVFAQEFLPATRQFIELISKLSSVQRADIDARAQDIQGEYASANLWMIVIGAIGLLSGLLLAVLLTRSITHPLSDALAVARTVAANDLTSNIAVRSRDEIGQLMRALQTMNGNLAATVARIRAGVDNIASASGQIAAGNTDLSSRTEQQAASLEQTAASMEELSSTVKQNADSARQANQLAAAASDTRARRRHGVGSGGRHERDLGQLGEDRRHRVGDRRHCLPDQHPGAERGRGSARGRAGQGLRGGRRRGPHAGAARAQAAKRSRA